MSETPFGACPVPQNDYERVVLGHGSGGRLSHELLKRVFLPAFSGDPKKLEDQATLALPTSGKLAFSTDAFVVSPLFFPGGDIGHLAVHGTVNDLAVGGATPRYLSASFILEEGLPISTLQRVVASMKEACAAAEVSIVTGDTKVVERGKADGLFITTSGVGFVPAGVQLSIANAKPGDVILASGFIGDHGVAILSVRDNLGFEAEVRSDTQPLTALCRAILEVGGASVRCMRDPTRGGIASALSELCEASSVGVRVDETSVPVRPTVQAACDLLGLDPYYVANEGKLLAIVAPEVAANVLSAMRAHPLGRDAARIGEVVDDHKGSVTVRSALGGERLLPMLAGDQLPRIC